MKFTSCLPVVASLFVALSDTALAKGVKGAPQESRRLDDKLTFSGGPERECEFSSKKDEVEFECKAKTGGDSSKDDTDSDEPTARGISIIPDLEIKDKIKYKVKTTNDGIQVKLEYKSEVETEETETETKTKFELLFISLVEYVKGPGQSENEAYDWDNDEIVQTVALTEWEEIPGVMSDGVGVVNFFQATNPLENGGSVSFNFTIAQADQGEHITANSMKIDTHIVNFPWTRTDSYVALMSTLQSEKKVKLEYEDEAEAEGPAKKPKDVIISFGDEMDDSLGFTTFGQYTWADDAQVESVVSPTANSTAMMARQGFQEVAVTTNVTETIQVIATSPADLGNETQQSIAYSFVGSAAQGASDIYWDPEAGIGYEASSSASLFSSIVGVIGGIMGAIIVAFW